MIRNILTTLAVLTLITTTGILYAYPKITGLTPVAIKSTSMTPSLMINDLIFIREQERYQVGDIVTFRAGSDLYTHKLIAEWTGDGHTGPFATQGIANKARDAQFLHSSAILGKALYRLPYMGFVQQVLSNTPVMIFIGLLALSLLLYPMILRPTRQPAAHTNATS